jgi:hypothetical protein
MKSPSPPSPTAHPNAYQGLSVGSVASLLVYEAKTRLGVDLTVEEAGFLVTGLVALVLFLGRKKT